MRARYTAGQHRWVVFNGWVPFYDIEPTSMPAEWHVWMHHVTDTPPTDVRIIAWKYRQKTSRLASTESHLRSLFLSQTTTGSVSTHKPDPILTQTDAKFERNLGRLSSKIENSKDGSDLVNSSTKRPRGPGLNSGIFHGPLATKVGETAYWTQPNSAHDPRSKTRTSVRSTFSLKDTPESLRAAAGIKPGSDGKGIDLRQVAAEAAAERTLASLTLSLDEYRLLARTGGDFSVTDAGRLRDKFESEVRRLDAAPGRMSRVARGPYLEKAKHYEGIVQAIASLQGKWEEAGGSGKVTQGMPRRALRALDSCTVLGDDGKPLAPEQLAAEAFGASEVVGEGTAGDRLAGGSGSDRLRSAW